MQAVLVAKEEEGDPPLKGGTEPSLVERDIALELERDFPCTYYQQVGIRPFKRNSCELMWGGFLAVCGGSAIALTAIALYGKIGEPESPCWISSVFVLGVCLLAAAILLGRGIGVLFSFLCDERVHFEAIEKTWVGVARDGDEEQVHALRMFLSTAIPNGFMATTCLEKVKRALRDRFGQDVDAKV